MIRVALALAAVACFAWSVAADIPPPPPELGFKRVPYEHVLKLSAELPAYKFFTFQQLGIRGKETVKDELKLGVEKGVVVPSNSSPSVRTGVVAVPVKLMDELKTKENLAKLLAWELKEKLPAGVVVYETRGTHSDLRESDPRTKVEYVITVSADEKAGVKFSGRELPAPAGKDGAASESARPPLATIMAGIAASLAIVMAGVWCFRSGMLPVAKTSPPQEEAK